jgi:hypothetical protein
MYERCECTASIGFGGNTATSPESSQGTGGKTVTQPHSNADSGGSMTTPETNGGAATGTGGDSSADTSVIEGTCAPKEMTGFVAPNYKAARVVHGACTTSDIETYYSDCLTAGNCTAFRSGGARERCGACLVPSELGSDTFGPLLKLGSSTAYVSSTNLAGCIELQGEPECAKKIQAEQLCEYHSCADSCPITDQNSYQALMSCLQKARETTCSAVQASAVCIADSAHIAACSAADLKGQFTSVAKAMCL